jgi:pyridoxal phosphate enzyme (YggS family)
MLSTPQNSGFEAAKTVADGLSLTHERIVRAANQYGRDAVDIRLIAVSKGHSNETLRTAVQLGQTEFGESYVQEALPKIDALREHRLTWHFIGQVQANKTRQIAAHFDWVHAIDRARIARRLHEHRPLQSSELNVCIEISLGDEVAKGGVAPDKVLPLAREIIQMNRLKLRGLMCIPPASPDFSQQLKDFQAVAQCQTELQRAGIHVDTLSMGMSADLEAAIAAGATTVRVGTAIFGERS